MSSLVNCHGPSLKCRPLPPGPAVRLNPRQIMPMSLILHELVTNAWKYGAFSNAEGLVHWARVR